MSYWIEVLTDQVGHGTLHYRACRRKSRASVPIYPSLPATIQAWVEQRGQHELFLEVHACCHVIKVSDARVEALCIVHSRPYVKPRAGICHACAKQHLRLSPYVDRTLGDVWLCDTCSLLDDSGQPRRPHRRTSPVFAVQPEVKWRQQEAWLPGWRRPRSVKR